MRCDGSMRVFSGVSISPFSDLSFFSCLAVGIAYDYVLAKQSIFLTKIGLDRFTPSVHSVLESCRLFSEETF